MRERAVRLDECLLRHVLDLGRVADETREQPRQLALVLLHQQLERSLVAALPLYQLPVDLAVRHACSLTAPGRAPRFLRRYVPQTQTD